MSDDGMDFNLYELQNVTNNFSEDHRVGSGGFGDVYKAVYKGKVIAVKKLHPLHGLDDKQFDNELLNLQKVNHQNVVKLVGYCHESRRKFVKDGEREFFATEMERVLCFEYMHGGALDKHIKDDSCDLDWRTCYQIIKGTCEGINHLHNAYDKPILHLDLKPANILLGSNKQAKIADLGLSKLVASRETYKTQTTTPQGTHGFMPPEYVDTAYVSNKFDVFSLGVIIIKIMDGDKGRTRLVDMGTQQFIERVCENWRKKLQEIPPGHVSHEIETLRVKKCVELALRCVAIDRKERPSIKDVIDELEKLEAEITKISPPSEESQTVQINLLSNLMEGSSSPSKNADTICAWVDTRNNNAKCYMIPSRLLSIEHANAHGYWSVINRPDSRFGQCTELKRVYFLAVTGEISTATLSPGMTYAVYLVYKLAADGAVGLSGVQESSVRLYGERIVATSFVCVDATAPAAAGVASPAVRPADDGWMEVKLAEFPTDDQMLKESKVIVDFRDENTAVLKKGLVIEGMEFRPTCTN